MTAQVVPFRRVSGSVKPRVATKRPRGRSRGGELVRFATDVLDLPPLRWQEWVLRAGMVQSGNRWASRTVGVMVGRQNGKTTLTTIRALGGMVLWGEQVVGAAQNRDIALEAWREAWQVAEDAGLTVHSVARTNGREEFWIGRSRYKIASSTRRGGRGLRADLVILDEVREFRDWEGWAALEKTRRARVSSQVWAISTAGDQGSVVLNSLADAGRSFAESQEDTDAAWFEWSAAPEVPRDDPKGWAAANPELGGLIPFESVVSESLHDAPEVFETEVLCRPVTTLRPWLPVGSWDRGGDPYASVPNGADVCFSLETGPELRHATIGVGWRRPDRRTFVESVAGFSDVDGPVLPRAVVRLAELVESWSPFCVVVRKGGHADAAVSRAFDDSEIEVEVVRLAGTEALTAVNSFYEAVIGDGIVHPPDPMTSSHIGAVTSDGLWSRRSLVADVDAAVAVCLSFYGAVRVPRPSVQDWTSF